MRRHVWPHLHSHPMMQLKCHSNYIYKLHLFKKDDMAGLRHLGDSEHSCILEVFPQELQMRHLL